jgi:hypothetical protein
MIECSPVDRARNRSRQKWIQPVLVVAGEGSEAIEKPIQFSESTVSADVNLCFVRVVVVEG